MQDNSEPSYYAIIPAEIRYDKRLSSSQKLLYAEITALSNQSGYCWASNKYFSELYNVNKNTISSWISSLCKHGYIEVDINRAKGNMRKVYLKKHIGIPKNMDRYNEKPVHNSKDSNKYNNIIKYIHVRWNEIFKDTVIPSVVNIRGARLTSLVARIKDNPEESFWGDYLDKIHSSDWLTGRNGDWRVTFDWIIQPKNMDKVLEGNYDNNKNQSEWLDKLKQYG